MEWANGTKPVDGGWVKGCPCGPDCPCIDKEICNAGDCKKNYAVLFTASWCAHCPRQKAIFAELKRDGYIVHVLDFDSHDEAAKRLKVTQLPTTIVFDNGKETDRYVGVTSSLKIKDKLKTAKEQESKPETKPDPEPIDYDLGD